MIICLPVLTLKNLAFCYVRRKLQVFCIEYTVASLSENPKAFTLLSMALGRQTICDAVFIVLLLNSNTL